MTQKLVFFPSAWSNELLFAPQIELLKNDYEIIVPDISDFEDIKSIADFVVKQYDDVACLIGLSFGGFIVQQILIDYPDFAPKAVLIATQAHGFDEDIKGFYRYCMQQVQAGKLPELLQPFVEIVISEARQNDRALIESIKDMVLSVGPKACINHHKAVISFNDKRAHLGKIKAKTLIICSSEDFATPPDFHEMIHQKIPTSTLVVLPQGGHFLTLEQPQAVNQHILNWLLKN